MPDDPNIDYVSYGQFAWMYNADPHVKNLIDQASREDWPADKLAAAIQGTPWWRTIVQSEREWNAFIARDPATALNQRNQKAEEIIRMGSAMGVTISQDLADHYADSFYRYGWTKLQLNNSILSAFQYKPGEATGAAGVIETQIRNAAAEYGVIVDDNAMKSWIISIQQGHNSVDTFNTWAAQRAAATYGWAAPALDRGLTLRAAAGDVIGLAARELGVDPAQIDLADPKWQKLLQASRDPKTGNFVQPSTTDALKVIRGDEQFGWSKSDAANSLADDGIAMFLRIMGKVA